MTPRLMSFLLVATTSSVAAAAPSVSPPPPSPELMAPASGHSEPRRLHPAVVLRDDEGKAVLESERPVSPAKTCGLCHDAEWIGQHSYHALLGLDRRTALGRAPSGRGWDFGSGLFGRWDPLSYSLVPFRDEPGVGQSTARWLRDNAWRLVGGGPSLFAQNGERWNWPDSGVAEMDCFVCHVAGAARQARIGELEAGRFGWAATATLAGTGLFRRDDGSWRPVREAFTDDGAVRTDRWRIRPPTPADCGACHGVVHESTEPLTLGARPGRDRMTETEGVVFSSQRIRESTLNIARKDDLSRPWDVHAERLVTCSNCHSAPNHPAYRATDHAPAHLAFDARRLDIGEYLLRPDHRFALRRCENCHDAARVHGWLPRLERHLSRLSCESCHIPRLYAPARAETDWSMLVRPGEPRITYRGTTSDSDLIEDYRPVLLPRRSADGTTELAPFNLVLTWFWVAGEGRARRPVPLDLLNHAFFREKRHHPELVRVLDRNRDGRLEPGELVLDTEERVATARRLLLAEGVAKPELVGEIEAYGIHHGVGPARFATRECRACHGPASLVTASFALARPMPWAAVPALVGDAPARLAGTLVRGPNQELRWVPDASRRDLYLFGHSRIRAVDGVGLGAVLLVLLGASIHGLLRWRLGRKVSA